MSTPRGHFSYFSYSPSLPDSHPPTPISVFYSQISIKLYV